MSTITTERSSYSTYTISSPYGEFDNPVTCGSGSTPSAGGAGGGSLKVVSGSLYLNGTISSNGGNGQYYWNSNGWGGGGSGFLFVDIFCIIFVSLYDFIYLFIYFLIIIIIIFN